MTILRALASHYDRLLSKDEVPPYGFSRENISYAIVLSPAGEVRDVRDLRDSDASNKKPRPKRLRVPQSRKRPGNIAPFFLWDNTGYVLGKGKDKEVSRVEKQHAAFKELHERLLAGINDEGLQAFLGFLKEWRVEDYDGLLHAEEMLGENVVFRLDGELCFLHEGSAAKGVWVHHLKQQDKGNAEGLCLVTGERAPIVRVHPAVKGIEGAQSSGANIVSFDKAAFKSFGKERGANAPISVQAAFKYTSALNKLLERGSHHRLRIGDTKTVFWAEAAGDETAAAEGEKFLLAMLDEPPTDEEERAKIADKLNAIAAGRPLADVAPGVQEDTRFYVLGIAPNAARLSIRFWHEDSIGGLAERIAEHLSDLALEPIPWKTPPAANRLLRETAVQGKFDNVPPILGGTLMRAILTGGRYPRSLLAAIIMRMRADRNINGLRAAICKACLARDYRLRFEREGIPAGLSREEPNVAYRLGRLFAVYEKVQWVALGKVDATIKDRYFGAASATPIAIFPLLERNSAHHLAKLRKDNKDGWYEREIDAILAGIGAVFPRSLRLEDQARFVLGYYHQRFDKPASKDDTGGGNSEDSEGGGHVS